MKEVTDGFGNRTDKKQMLCRTVRVHAALTAAFAGKLKDYFFSDKLKYQ